jgi:hypothetical protein
MGKQLGGINGPYMGKIGNVVGYQWRGMWVTRAMPAEFHDAKSERQLEQRGRFKAMVRFAARLKDILRIGLNQSAMKLHKTECNYFQMINKDRLSWNGEDLNVDYEHLRLSEGPVAPVAFHIESEELRIKNEELVIAFEKNPEHRNCSSSDHVYVAAICGGRCEAVLSLPVYRRMGKITISLPTTWDGEEVHLYGFVQDSAGRCSESTYIGRHHAGAPDAGIEQNEDFFVSLQHETDGDFSDDCLSVADSQRTTHGDGLGLEGRGEDRHPDARGGGTGTPRADAGNS